VGKIKLERVFVEKICNETSNKIQSNNAWDRDRVFGKF
jgi:hypothetical protein